VSHDFLVPGIEEPPLLLGFMGDAIAAMKLGIGQLSAMGHYGATIVPNLAIK
jgi:hypothetical protein